MQTNLITDRYQVKSHTLRMDKFDKDTEFANRFRKLVKEKGWDNLNRVDIGKKIVTSGACATYYWNGDRLPGIPQARTMCKIFRVNIEWFLTGDGLMRADDKQPSSPILDKFNQLCPDQQREVTEFIDFKLSQNKENKPLTAQQENVGGGVNLFYPLSAYKRRQNQAADQPFCDAVKRDIEDAQKKDAVIREDSGSTLT